MMKDSVDVSDLTYVDFLALWQCGQRRYVSNGACGKCQNVLANTKASQTKRYRLLHEDRITGKQFLFFAAMSFDVIEYFYSLIDVAPSIQIRTN